MTVSTDGGDVELEISDDPHDCRRLDVENIPVVVTLSKVCSEMKTINHGFFHRFSHLPGLDRVILLPSTTPGFVFKI